MAQNLRPPILEALELRDALESYCQEFSIRTRITLTFEADPTIPLISDVNLITLYRFLQEALTNITRYAQASNVWVELSVEENWLSLTIQDNGIGFDDSARSNGIGITGLEERLTLVGGKLVLNSTIGRGTIITARLPMA